MNQNKVKEHANQASLQILPLTFKEFTEKYHIYDFNEYKVYLDTNRDIHHYGKLSYEEWIKKES